jgi:hypothetical protein
MSLYDDENEHLLDAIQKDAADAAAHAWGPLGSPKHRPCPHPEGSEEAESWWLAFHRHYAMENGK